MDRAGRDWLERNGLLGHVVPVSANDKRSRAAKLAAMAGQEAQSPREAAIARRMLRETGQDANPMLRPPRKKLKPQNFRVVNGEWIWDGDD